MFHVKALSVETCDIDITKIKSAPKYAHKVCILLL